MLKYRKGECDALFYIGLMSWSTGDRNNAFEAIAQALEISRTEQEPAKEKVYNDLGKLQMQQMDYTQAEANILKSLRIRRDIKYRSGQATTLLDLGDLYCQQNHLEKAVAVLEEALVLAGETGEKPKISRAHQLLAQAFAQQGQFEKALAHYQQYHAEEADVHREAADHKLKEIQTRHQLRTGCKVDYSTQRLT